MSVDTRLITKLRELTGAGINDCKAALEEAENNINKAVEVLRKKGAVKAAKKAERATKEGVIAFSRQGNRVAVVGLACETDFVARTGDFIKTVSDFANKLLDTKEEEFKKWAEEWIKNELVVKISENIQLVFAEVVEGEVLGTYLHSNKKIASVVVLAGGTEELATELAMKAAAMSPKYIKPEDVDPAELKREKDIYKEQLKTEGKPEAMWDKIIAGKVNKYYQEVCLIKQPFIKDDKISVEKFIEQSGSGIEIVKIARYKI